MPGNYLFIISSILDLELSHFYSAQNYFSYPELKRDGKYEDFVSTNITNMEEYLNEAIREIKTFTIVENSTLTQNDVFLIENIIKSIINYVKDSEIKEDK